MRISFKYALGLVALLPFLQGCDHKPAPAQPPPPALAPPIEDAPPPKPATVSPADLPPVVIGNTPPPETKNTTVKPPEPAKKPVKHPKKPPAATPPVTTPAQDTTGVTPPPATPETTPAEPSVPAAGNITTGAAGGQQTETERTINAVEKGVNGITRPLSDSETKTAAQIREFIKQAREALATGDADGAHTLAEKAKVLLGELNQ